MKNLIAISGKIGSGKDTVGKIIQYLTSKENPLLKIETYIHSQNSFIIDGFEVRKFAGKLKDIVCLLIGCTREQLEDADFKNKELSEEWWYFKGRTGSLIPYRKDSKLSDEDLIKLTPRLLLQLLGTECGREIIHPNIWVNALFADYKSTLGVKHKLAGEDEINEDYEPHEDDIIDVFSNWIITDLRFPNEFEAVKNRGGITIRVNRPRVGIVELNTGEKRIAKQGEITEHPSETALDSTAFDYVIENNGSLEDLIEKVKEILIIEQIIKHE